MAYGCTAAGYEYYIAHRAGWLRMVAGWLAGAECMSSMAARSSSRLRCMLTRLTPD
jgi:hypothetical protein